MKIKLGMLIKKAKKNSFPRKGKQIFLSQNMPFDDNSILRCYSRFAACRKSLMISLEASVEEADEH